jgi:drug/metabolite transporter (DMT)-like permease
MGTDERLLWKTRLFLALVIVSQPLGNLFLTLGMKHRILGSPWDYLAAIFTPNVALGIVLLIIWLLSRMALLSWADLSYVLPLTAIGYIITAIIGRVVLNEQISLARWSGTLLIVAGTALVGLTESRTSPEELARTTERSPNEACSAGSSQVPDGLAGRAGPVRASGNKS